MAIDVTEMTKAVRRDIYRGLNAESARWLVDFYYAVQDFRIQAQGETRAIRKAQDEGTFELGGWLAGELEGLEKEIVYGLDKWSGERAPGVWAKSITGVGPVIAAGLLAHIDVAKAPTVGHIWRFAGLDPSVRWERKTKRPWNAKLKVLCWKIGDSFSKQKGRESDVYGKVIDARKAIEVERNEAGAFADQARAALAERRYGQDTDARLWYSGCLSVEASREFWAAESAARQGLAKRLAGEPGSGVEMLPPGRLELRARRVAVKLFLAHWHHVAYWDAFGEDPPKPYVLEHAGHAHFIAPPNWPLPAAS